MARATSRRVAPNPSSDRISRSSDTDSSPASIFATLEFGKFGWVMDPEGNKVELWEPPACPVGG